VHLVVLFKTTELHYILAVFRAIEVLSPDSFIYLFCIHSVSSESSSPQYTLGRLSVAFCSDSCALCMNSLRNLFDIEVA
jgi:hypothetical protein